MSKCIICEKKNEFIITFPCLHKCCFQCLLNIKNLKCNSCNIDISKHIPKKIQNIMYNLKKEQIYGPYCNVKPGEFHECDSSCFP